MNTTPTPSPADSPAAAAHPGSAKVLARAAEAVTPTAAPGVLALLLETLAHQTAADRPIFPGALANLVVEAVDEGLTGAIRPGDRVAVEVNDRGRTATGTVASVEFNAIGSRTAEIEFPDGTTFTQATKFLRRIEPPVVGEWVDEVAELLGRDRTRRLIATGRTGGVNLPEADPGAAAAGFEWVPTQRPEPVAGSDRRYLPLVVAQAAAAPKTDIRLPEIEP